MHVYFDSVVVASECTMYIICAWTFRFMTGVPAIFILFFFFIGGGCSSPSCPPPLPNRHAYAFRLVLSCRKAAEIDQNSNEDKTYSLNKKEWICSLFKEWILEKSEIRVNLEWTFVLFTHFGVISGSLGIPDWSLWSLQNEWITQMFTRNSLQIHSNFTLF